MMRMQGEQRRLWVCHVFSLAIFLIGLTFPFLAAAVEGKPTDRVRDTLEDALRVLDDPALQGPEKKEARRQEVRKLIAASFNYPEMAARSLDTYWVKLSDGQRQEFVDLFGELFERSYSRLVLNSLPDQQIVYTGESLNGTKAVVKTILVDKRGDRLPVDYRLQRRNGRWKLFDVVIDGVSIVVNYQSQFNKIIRTSSYEALVKKMRLKRDEE
ncbi:MAG: phospholipid-binding protein MlaC [Candidatus Methylomirabilales bacterium]